MNILIVDDEPSLIVALRPILKAAGHEVFAAPDAQSALAAIGQLRLDLVLLDLGLPDADGCDLIAAIKTRAQARVIVLSARHLESDKVCALDEGADDYVDKPFGTDELLARIRGVERRLSEAGGNAVAILASRSLRVDFARRRILLLGEPIHLSPKEFALFEVLARHSGQVVTQRRLMIAGWNDPNIDGQYLRSYVAMLREKLEADPSDPELILTETGVGYRLSEQLVPLGE